MLAAIAAGPAFAQGLSAVRVYEKTAKSVVLITARSQGNKSYKIGAGSIIADSGLIVTNSHVVVQKDTHKPFSEINVFIKPDRVTGDLGKDLKLRHRAKVVAFDRDLDIALIRAARFPPEARRLELADPRDIKIGEEVVAIGHPEQGGLWTLTYGRISGEIANQSKVKGKDVYQTDTSVNRGNSGGPLLDKRGYLVGLNTSVARRGKDNMAIVGVNFALKSSVVRKWLAEQGVFVPFGTAPLNESPKKVTASPTVPPIAPEAAKPGPPKSSPNTPIKTPAKQPPLPPDVKGQRGKMPSDTILTPKRPFSHDALFLEVEKEMEDMMQDMRRRIRRD